MERLNSPYIGVTGFTQKEQVTSTLETYPTKSGRLLMVGALISAKTLRGIPLQSIWQKRMVDPNILKELFLSSDQALNLVHFNTANENYLDDLLAIRDLAGPNFHGFQLNMAWPDISQLERYRLINGYNERIVLQIGRKAITQTEHSPNRLISMLGPYSDLINDILFDPSGGQGKSFDANIAHQFLSAVSDSKLNIGLGVAGGLGPDSLDILESLIRSFPNLNIDAEGKLRDEQGNLDLNTTKLYLSKAVELFNFHRS